MTRTKSLIAAWIAACLALLALTGSASAVNYTSINGDRIDVFSNGKGQFNADFDATQGSYYFSNSRFFYDSSADVLAAGAAEAGLNLAVYDHDGAGTDRVYGFRGTPFTTTSIPGRTGNGSLATPYVLTSKYTTGDCATAVRCLEITETAQYVNTQLSVLVTYDVKNVSQNGQPVRFRVTTGGDVFPGGVEGGTGRFIDGGVRFVGTLNQDRGAGMDLQESGGAPAWDHYMEGVPFSVWRKVQEPAGAGLTDSVQQTHADKAAAVQWDTHTASGLAHNATAHFEVRWRFRDFDSLEVPSPGNKATHTQVSIPVTGLEEDNVTPTNFSTSPLYWRTKAGSKNPQLGTHLGTWNQITESDGITSIQYTGANPGYDNLEIWVDSDNDGVRDGNEPYRERSVWWYDRVDVDYSNWDNAYVGYQNYVHLATRNQSYGYEARSFKYYVVDKASGATRIPESAVLTTSGVDGDYHDPAPIHAGESGIPLTRSTPGTDVVHVLSDHGNGFAGDGTYGNEPGEHATYEVNWRNRVQPSPSATALATDATGDSIYVYTYTSDGDEGSADIGWWATDPNAGDPSAHVHDEAPQAPVGWGELEVPLDAGTVGLGPLVGGQRLYHFYTDDDGSGDHTPGEPVGTTAVDWYIPATNRLTFGSYNSYATVGHQRTLTPTLRTNNGDPALGVKVRYDVTGENPLAQTLAGTTDSSGQVTITLASATTGDDSVSAYGDLNDNGTREGNEPRAFAYIDWVAAIQVSASDVHVPAQASAFVTFRNQNGQAQTPLSCSYEVTGTHGVPSTGCPLISGGFTTITWPGAATNVTGTDTITVNANVAGVGSSSNSDTATFLDQLDLTPRTSTRTVGQSIQIYPDSFGTSDSGRTYQYTITGANPQSGTVNHGQYLQYTGANAGIDTITVSTTNPNIQSVATVEWRPAQLTLTGTGDATQGATKTVTATFRDSTTGTPVTGTTLRWIIEGSNQQLGKNAAITDSNGQVEISWPTSDPGTSTATSDYVTVYADIDDNGARDSGSEPQLTDVQVRLHPQLEPDDTYEALRQGASKTVNVTFRDMSFQPRSGEQLMYEVVDYSVGDPAGNPQPPTAVPQPTNGSGQTSVTVTGTNPGHEYLRIWKDSNSNSVRDAGEISSTTELLWRSRVVLFPSGSTTRAVTAGPLAINGNLYTVGGSSQPNATVKYTITGLHATNGVQTKTTDGFGEFTINLPADEGGQDVVTAWFDADNDDELDPTESKAVTTVTWTGAVAINTYSQSLFTGAAHSTITVSGSGLTGSPPIVRVSFHGPNARGRPTLRQPYTGAFNIAPITGGLPGTDWVHAWWDKNDDGDQDADERGATSYITWKPQVTFGAPSGSLEAGNPTTVTAKLVDSSGTPMPSTGIRWKTTGANPNVAQSATTDGSGEAQLTYTGTNTGTDTLIVWKDTSDPANADSGEPQGSRTIHWAAPPVTLTPTPASDTKYQGNQSSFMVVLTGMPGGANAGQTIRWSTTGANATSGTATTNGLGQATIQWTGTNDGEDTLTAYADVSGASGSRDGYDPATGATMTWTPLVRISGGPSENSIGSMHTETVNFVDEFGNPLANAQVIHQISGANPTAGQVVSRPIGSSTGSRLLSRTDGAGNATVSWTGSNAGVDTLDVWADRNGNGVVDGSEPHAQKTVTWGTAAAAGTGGGLPGTGTSGPIGGAAQVPTESDFDGLPTPPPPVVAKKVNVAPVSGKVLVRLPGSNRFIELLDAEQIPVGSVVDVKRGRVALTASQNLKDNAVATAQFYLGVFKIAQKRAAKPVTDLVLFGGSFKPCGKIARARRSSDALAQASKAKPKKRVRQLWGNGKGLFRTKGKYAAAAIRGTIWNVTDYCNGTLVKVNQGSVTVTDIVKKRNVIVKARKSYFAEAKPARAGRRR